MSAIEDSSGFAGLGLGPKLLATLAELGYEEPTADPARGDPAAARRARPARTGRDRHRQDGRLRPAAAAATRAEGRRRARSWASSWSRRASSRCRSRRRSTATAASSARACCRSTADSRSGASSRRCGAASTSSSRRRAARSTTSARGTLALDDGARWSCSTRPTRCSTWASPRTSRRSSARRPPSGRRCCSRRRCRRGSTPIARRHLRDPVQIRIGREPLVRGRGAAGAPDRLRRRRARTSRPRSAASSTSRRPTAAHRLLPHAASRSTS